MPKNKSNTTPEFIRKLTAPVAKQQAGRKAWSVDLQSVWIPYFTVTNMDGDTSVPNEALGAPLRLGYNKDGSVKFSASGKPVMRIAKELSDAVRDTRDNFVASLVSHAETRMHAAPDAYRKEADANRRAGKPIIDNDRVHLESAIAQQMEEAAAAAAKNPAADETHVLPELVPA